MKRLLLFLLCQGSLDSFSQGKIQDKPRYFLVGYFAHNNIGNCLFISNDGHMPKKKEILDFYNKEFPKDTAVFNSLTIISLYEFRTKKEAEEFDKYQKQQK